MPGLGFGRGLRSSRGTGGSSGGGGSGTTVLFRETDATVTIVSLATPWSPSLSRETDATVTVGN